MFETVFYETAFRDCFGINRDLVCEVAWGEYLDLLG